jgi:hypothetical protein
MAFASTGGNEKMDDLTSIDEIQLSERHDAGLVERGLEREVVPASVLIEPWTPPPIAISFWRSSADKTLASSFYPAER